MPITLVYYCLSTRLLTDILFIYSYYIVHFTIAFYQDYFMIKDRIFCSAGGRRLSWSEYTVGCILGCLQVTRRSVKPQLYSNEYDTVPLDHCTHKLAMDVVIKLPITSQVTCTGWAKKWTPNTLHVTSSNTRRLLPSEAVLPSRKFSANDVPIFVCKTPL